MPASLHYLSTCNIVGDSINAVLIRRTANSRLLAAALFACIPLLAQGPAPRPSHQAWMNTALSPDRRADLVISAMTLDEKIQLVHGAGMFEIGPHSPELGRSNGGGGFVPGIPRLGIPDLNMDDSAVGVGGDAKKGRYSTALPSTIALASSWDQSLARDYGALIGRELADQGYNVSLAGGVDITREPRNGRNFEYQGEDPILAGNMVAGLITGIQSQGVIGDIKHYALNDEETGRYFANAILDKRSLRESDLLAFEIGVKKAHPGMVMCSYNLVNGDYACENKYLLSDVLKHDWGFQGWVISDWFATHSCEKAALAGLDQQQPSFDFFGAKLKAAIEARRVPLSRLNDMVHRILRTEFAVGIIDHPQPTQVPDVEHGFAVAQRVEENSAVLLKNTGRQLPLNAGSLKSIAVIGSHADVGVLSGGGSGQVDAAGGSAIPTNAKPGDVAAIFTIQVWHRSSPLNAIEHKAPNASVTFDAGDNPDSAARAAAAADVAIVFLHQHTHEGGDVLTLALPDRQDALVDAVAKANSHTVVVLETGGPVAMPWIDSVSAVLEAWYPGIRGGQAIANLLFGDVNPSGKLAVTFAKSDADLPHPEVPGPAGPRPGPMDGLLKIKPSYDIRYTEGLKVGYKWFDAENKDPLFPFGFGLSYTDYAYSDVHCAREGDAYRVSFTLRNAGERPGSEIAEIYAALPVDANEPPKRLIGWEKVSLAPGESKTITVTIDPLYLSVFDEAANRWKLLPGDYRILAGKSSRDLPLETHLQINR
jgi:beta-glucosidase